MAVQHMYMLTCGAFPFNAYLAGLGASLGGATLASALCELAMITPAMNKGIRCKAPHASVV